MDTPLPMIDRRRVLALLAASSALATGACRAPPPGLVHPFVEGPEAQAAGTPLFYATSLLRDGHAMGVLAGTQQGRPIKVEGNPLHPSSGGATDAIAQAAVLQLWDPDRSRSVLQPTGVGVGALAPSTWPGFEADWRAQASRLDETHGEGLRLLSSPTSSPTERALIAALLQRWPRAAWHVHEPLTPADGRAGLRQAFGRPLMPVWRFDTARCIVALGADPFSDGPGAVRHALDWSLARERGREDGSWPRLFALEVAPGLFGARADERIALPPPRIEALLWRVARRWFPELPPSRPAEGDEAAFESRLVQALQAAGPDAILVPGRALSTDAQALAHALNQRLGAIGRGVSLVPRPEGDALALTDLAQALAAGAVDTLVMVDTNPAYDTPGALAFAKLLPQARWRAHAGLYPDETAAASHWHLPLTHDFEQWGDALAHDGTAGLQQPALLPLYEGRSRIELLATLLDAPERQGRALVQSQWRSHGEDFDAIWRDSLRRGVVAGSRPEPVRPPPARLPAQPPRTSDDLVAVFSADPCVHDGRYANLGWLQELPRPFSKRTWDNAVEMGPRTAARLKLGTGDFVELSAADGRRVSGPVWVEARHAEGALTLPLGHGRRHAGRIANGVGFDAYALMPATGAACDVALQRSEGHHEFAVTQHAIDEHQRELVRFVAPGGRLEDHDAEQPSLYRAPPSPGHAWAMSIDLDACTGCNACTVACQAENNIPVVGRDEVAKGRVMHWIRIDRYDTPATVFQPVPCMHCENAPCELVCPVGATVHDSEGLNLQVYNRCIGTRFCSNNCPYKVRRFNFLAYTDDTTEMLKAQRNPDVTVRRRGVMEKCTYCIQRISRARRSQQAGGPAIADGDVVTACQAACPTRAIRFGDLHDPGSDIAKQKASPRHYALLGELNTRPRTTYLARVGAPGRKDR